MNKKIALSGLSILVALALVGGATFAYFSDMATSTNNAFAAGTLNLQLDDEDQSTPEESVSASISSLNLAPGDSVTGFISLHNDGSIPIAEVEFGANQTVGDDTPNLTDVIDLTVLTGSNSVCSDGTDHTSNIDTIIGDGIPPLTLSELIATDYDALPGIAAGGTYYLCLTGTMEVGAGDEYQGDSATVNFVFTGNQDAGM